MKKIARTAVLALVAMGAFAISIPAHAGIAGSDPQPPVSLPPSSGGHTTSLMMVAVLSVFGI